MPFKSRVPLIRRRSRARAVRKFAAAASRASRDAVPRDWRVAIVRAVRTVAPWAPHSPDSPQCERDRRARCSLIVGFVPLLFVPIAVGTSKRDVLSVHATSALPRLACRNVRSSSGSPLLDPRCRSLAAKTRGLRGDRTPAKCQLGAHSSLFLSFPVFVPPFCRRIGGSTVPLEKSEFSDAPKFEIAAPTSASLYRSLSR